MISIIEFPGTNCQNDVKRAYEEMGYSCKLVRGELSQLPSDTKLVVIAGGYSYGDYLRCGAVAARDKIMDSIKEYADGGGVVVGICNGFQILCEAGLLPGALFKNQNCRYVSRSVELVVKSSNNSVLCEYQVGDVVRMPIAHGYGNYQVCEKEAEELFLNEQVILCYKEDINGSVRNIAGICNEGRNVYGLMPHPERATSRVSINRHSKNFSAQNSVGLKILRGFVP